MMTRKISNHLIWIYIPAFVFLLISLLVPIPAGISRALRFSNKHIAFHYIVACCLKVLS